MFVSVFSVVYYHLKITIIVFSLPQNVPRKGLLHFMAPLVCPTCFKGNVERGIIIFVCTKSYTLDLLSLASDFYTPLLLTNYLKNPKLS